MTTIFHYCASNDVNGNPQRLYALIDENEDILVEHRISTYTHGERSATMLVHLKKDGLLWRTETGVTPLPEK